MLQQSTGQQEKPLADDTLLKSAKEQIDLFIGDADEFENPINLLYHLFDSIELFAVDGIYKAQGIVEGLIKYFLIPEHSAAFQKITKSTRPEDLANFLTQSSWIYQNMDREKPKAFFERIELDYSIPESRAYSILMDYKERNENAAAADITAKRYREASRRFENLKH